MPPSATEIRRWHDWTDPDFFAHDRGGERRFVPLFLRQIFPQRTHRTKLTVTGWFLIMVAMGIGTAAYNTASNILFMTLSLLLSSLVLSGILSTINFRKLRWSLQGPKHLKAGEVGAVDVGLENGKRFFPSMSLNFLIEATELEAPTRLYLAHGLSAGEQTRLEWTFVPRRRGRYHIRLSGVGSQFPFGFLEKVIRLEESTEVLVWPARIGYRFGSVAGGRRLFSGSSRRRPGMGTDLLNLRPYERGDPPRLIHWKATARMRRLMIRQLAQEGEDGYHLRVDPFGEWAPDTFEALCSVAASLADDLFHAGKLETVGIVGEVPRQARSIRELHEFYNQLALLETAPAAHRPEAERRQRRNTIRFRAKGAEGGIAILVDEIQCGETDD